MTYLNTSTMNPVGFQSQPSPPTEIIVPTAAPSQPVNSPLLNPTTAPANNNDQLSMSYQPTGIQAPPVSFNQGLPVQSNAAPMLNVTNQNFSPYVPTLSTLSISKEGLAWATDFEQRVQNGYQPTQEEVSYYKSLADQLSMMRNNIQPMTPAPALPQIQNWNPAPAPAQQQPQQQAPTSGKAFGPGMPPLDQQVTMSEIEWALIIEEKVQKYAYKPTPEEETKYQNILTRFKNNSEIKMEFLDALAAQSPWVGANVATIRYSKVAAGQVSKVISAIKTGTGSVAGSLKSLGGTLLKSTGLSALVSGGFSAVTNGIAYWQGKKTATQAVSNVVTDTVSGAATGLGATLAGGAAMAALAGTSVAGFGLTLLVGGASILGGYLTDMLMNKTGAKQWVKSKVIALMDGLGSPKKDPQPAQQTAQTAAAQPSMPQPAMATPYAGYAMAGAH